jgi:hypothetical protein
MCEWKDRTQHTGLKIIPHRIEINPSKAHNIKSTPLQYG